MLRNSILGKLTDGKSALFFVVLGIDPMLECLCVDKRKLGVWFLSRTTHFFARVYQGLPSVILMVFITI